MASSGEESSGEVVDEEDSPALADGDAASSEGLVLVDGAAASDGKGDDLSGPGEDDESGVLDAEGDASLRSGAEEGDDSVCSAGVRGKRSPRRARSCSMMVRSSRMRSFIEGKREGVRGKG
jgi:hypothetical protein